PSEPRLATNHLIASQYRNISTRAIAAFSIWNAALSDSRDLATPAATARPSTPRYHQTTVPSRPVKARFGRPGTWVRETIHPQYISATHGNGMMSRAPMKNASECQVNSQIPKSTETDPLAASLVLASDPHGGSAAGSEGS